MYCWIIYPLILANNLTTLYYLTIGFFYLVLISITCNYFTFYSCLQPTTSPLQPWLLLNNLNGLFLSTIYFKSILFICLTFTALSLLYQANNFKSFVTFTFNHFKTCICYYHIHMLNFQLLNPLLSYNCHLFICCI